MYKNIRDLPNKLSDKLLIGAISLETLIGNSSLALAQESSENLSSPDYSGLIYTLSGLGLGVTGIGTCLVRADNNFQKNMGRILEGVGLGVLTSAIILSTYI